MKKVVYLGLDVHSKCSVLGRMDGEGKYEGDVRFPTSESELIRHVVAIEADEKHLILEECSLARWTAQTLAPYVTKVVICDPKENRRIGWARNKNDRQDAYQLCKVLRLGDYKEVYQAATDHRAEFKEAVQFYMSRVQAATRVKNQIRAVYLRSGVTNVEEVRAFDPEDKEYPARLSGELLRGMVEDLLELLALMEKQAKRAFRRMVQAGRRYPEIARFQKIPGVGPVTAHVFSAWIQAPERFASERRLWSYCGLGISERSSDNKPLGYRRLNRDGNPILKHVSYMAFMAARRSGSEFGRFFEAVLERTGNRTHARLTVQRRILQTMWLMWRRGTDYNPARIEAGAGSASSPPAAAKDGQRRA